MLVQSVDSLRKAVKAALEPAVWPVRLLRHTFDTFPGLALLLLGMLITAAVLAIRGDRLFALALVPLSLAWVLFNGPFEGPTLVVLSWSHGITASDLISVAGLTIAAWRLTPALVGR